MKPTLMLRPAVLMACCLCFLPSMSALPTEDALEMTDAPQVMMWAVKGNATQDGNFQECLTMAADLTIVLVTDKRNTSYIVPQFVDATGTCGEMQEDITFEWMSPAQHNISLTLVITKNMGLAVLSEARFRLIDAGKREKNLVTMLDDDDYWLLSWPIKYRLACPQELVYPLYSTVEDSVELSNSSAPAEGYLIINQLNADVFRELNSANLEAEDSEKDEWECEFHTTTRWAPIIVVSSLAALVASIVVAFVCKKKLSSSKTNAYQQI